jgi:hypothetical protein
LAHQATGRELYRLPQRSKLFWSHWSNQWLTFCDFSYEAVAQYDDSQRKFIALPIDLSDGQVYLILFGTGLRYRSSQEAVKVKIGGVEVPVFYAGAQGAFAGLDQINALLPTNLSGRGEVEIEVTVDGQSANSVHIHISQRL